MVPVSSLIGMDLPPRQVTNILLDSYISSVHWFMIVFHEPTLRVELDEILTSGLIQPRRLSFLILILSVLALGAKYAKESDSTQQYNGLELPSLHSKLILKVEQSFVSILDGSSVESVQICVLLASYHIYDCQPKKANSIIGAGIRTAWNLGLHREATWGAINPIAREVRRRVWWALYVAEGYASYLSSRSETLKLTVSDLPLSVTGDVEISTTLIGKST